MKSFKNTVLAVALLASAGLSGVVSAEGGFAEADYGSRYFEQMRPMTMKLSAADKKKAAEMEMAIMKMEADHAMSMAKATMEHKMAIMKMRFEYEAFISGKGAF
jgi:hypothetical protein